MNHADAERVSSVLTATGWTETKEAKEADLYIFVTCSVRQKAEDRVFGLLEVLADWKQARAGRQIAITGCMARLTSNRTSTKPDPLLRRCPLLDLVWRMTDTHLVPDLLGAKLAPTAPSDDEYYKHFFAINPERKNPVSALIPIMTGCDNWCTYCIVPVTRGREVSRPQAEILTECRKAVAGGALEITLIGQNVDSYQKSSEAFAELLAEVARIPNLRRVRFMSSHPKDISPAVMDVMAAHPTIERHLHLAVQHGDNAVLERMNRGYTAAEFLKKIRLFRKKVPGATVTTDIIVGFPGETPAAFKKLVKFYKQAAFDFAFISRYSPRRGTASAKLWKDDVPREVKAARWNELNQLLLTTTNQLLQKRIGQTLEVLVERSENGLCSGRSSEFIFTKFLGTPDLIGTIQPVKINLAKEIELVGKIAK